MIKTKKTSKNKDSMTKSSKYYAARLAEIAAKRDVSSQLLCAALRMNYSYTFIYRRLRPSSQSVALLKYLESLPDDLTSTEFIALIERDLVTSFDKQVEEWEQ